MSTPIDITFYLPLRIMLGDLDPSVQRYPDLTLQAGVKTVIQLGKLRGYSLGLDGVSITPDLVGPGICPDKFALACYHTVKLFVDPIPDRMGFRTRELSEQHGNVHRFLQSIEMEIHKLENGAMFSAWQNYFSWLSGMAGLPLAEVMTDMHVQAPLWDATLTREGMRQIPDQRMGPLGQR